MKPFDLFAIPGDIVLAVLAMIGVAVIVAVYLIVCAANKLQEMRWLGPIAVGVTLGIALHCAGCASNPTPARDARDPEVWRPTTPAVYPLPR